MVSTFAAVVLAALGLTGTPSAGHAAPSSPAFFAAGHGWGHGVGLAQYGAYGYALHGWTYDQIVAHYYPGTSLGQAPLKRVRVLLTGGTKRVVISSTSPFTVRDASGKVRKLSAGRQALGPGLKLKLAAAPKLKALRGPLVFSPGADPLSLGRRSYRGTLRVSVSGSLRVVNTVGLEPYLWGVVPSEMPDRWPAEALQAQAVVARSYALSHLQKGGDFDLYADTRSQVYGGIAAEADTASDAVTKTAGQVVLYQGQPADTFFSSSSGGRTANVQDVWPTSPPLPYLVSVPDPYDTLSPYHDWGPLRFTPGVLGRRLGARGRLIDVKADRAASGRVRTLTVIGTKGVRTITGSAARAALGMRSTWFTIGMLNLTPPAAPVVFGASARLAGRRTGRGKGDARVATLRWAVEAAHASDLEEGRGRGDALAQGLHRLPALDRPDPQRRRAALRGAVRADHARGGPPLAQRARAAAPAERRGTAATTRRELVDDRGANDGRGRRHLLRGCGAHSGGVSCACGRREGLCDRALQGADGGGPREACVGGCLSAGRPRGTGRRIRRLQPERPSGAAPVVHREGPGLQLVRLVQRPAPAADRACGRDRFGCRPEPSGAERPDRRGAHVRRREA